MCALDRAQSKRIAGLHVSHVRTRMSNWERRRTGGVSLEGKEEILLDTS